MILSTHIPLNEPKNLAFANKQPEHSNLVSSQNSKLPFPGCNQETVIYAHLNR